MKYLDEFNDPELARRLFDEIARVTTRRWAIMEVCGGQTHSIIRNGIDQLLPDRIELIHGPGCPVCVTPLGVIDKALEIASRPDVIFCSFGDMLRVPGSGRDLFQVKSLGGDVRIVYSPLDAVQLAEQNPDRQVVFFAIGFETTAPANAMAVHLAAQRELTNFSVLVSHVLVPPAISAIASAPVSRVDGFLAAGHVCSVMGTWQYGPLVEEFGLPIVVTGFEPLDVLDGIRRVVVQLEAGEARLERVRPGGVRGRQRACPADDRRCVRSLRPAVAGHRHDPDQRVAPVAEVRRVRRRAAIRRRRHRHAGVVGVPGRRGAAGAHQTQSVRGVRRGVYPSHTARRDHGLERRCVRRLLPVPAARRRTREHRQELSVADADPGSYPAPDFENWSCPLPLRSHDRVVIGHGGGGKLSAELIEHLFLPAFGRVEGSEMHDAATLAVAGASRLAFSTDSYVVRPLFFPGGCIGDLAVNGTINDVAMSGAVPIALSAGFIVEEGLE
ncbi:MAG: hydrogenase formation protein HypD, partial [Ilumatobacteraceae bacterium]